MSFTKKRTLDESIKIIGALVQVCAKKGGHICKKLSKLFSDRDYLAIIDYQFDYQSLPIDTADVLYARQIQALLSKQDFIDLGVNKESVAYDRFLASEEECKKVNRRFRINAPGKSGVEQVLYLSRRKIAEILGDVPDISNLTFSFGPGTNTSTKMHEANPRIKLSSSLQCNTNFLPFAESFLDEFPIWKGAHEKTKTSEFNRKTFGSIAAPHLGKLMFVPKNCKTFRSIVVEPIISGMYQKGIGLELRRILRGIGLDLRDQTANQKLALKGSEEGEIATLDLSMASDSIAYGFVLDQLPPAWFHLLEIGRSDMVIYKKGIIVLQKFSSMGNAYTFELESLLFYSLAYATCVQLGLDPEYVRSYGDDIIIPVAAVPLMTDVLAYCGFSLNSEKSFSAGPFRESCGADYLFGFDIRPFYLKERISDRVLFLMHNWFVRHLEFELAEATLTFIPPLGRLWGPDGYGDGHLVGNHTLRTSRKRIRNGYEGGVFDTYTTKKKENKKSYFGDYVFPCYTVYVKSDVFIQQYDRSNILCPPELCRTELHDKRVNDRDQETDPNVIRGDVGYKRISIYTLATTIFGSVKFQKMELN